MNRDIILWVVLGVVGVLALFILSSYWQFLFFSLLFAAVFSAWNKRLAKRIGPNASAFIVTIAVILLLVVPTLYVISETIAQAPIAYQGALTALDKESVQHALGVSGDEVRAIAVALGDKLKANVLQNAAVYLNTISDVVIGIVIMFLTLFFMLRDGNKIIAVFIKTAPVQRQHVESLVSEMRGVINAVVLGQVVAALIQGALIGLLFWAFGLPNAIFWGVVATIISAIPILGPFFIYIPASAYLFLQDRYVAAVTMLVLGIAVISVVDNVIRPYIATRSAHIHPLVPILGIIGGLKLWGFVGFIVGPLVLAAFLTLYTFATTNTAKNA